MVYSKKYKNTRPFKCNICKEKFMFSRGLHFHNTIHTNPLVCKFPNCGKKFSRVCSYQLKLHENKHHRLVINKIILKRKFDDELDQLDENHEKHVIDKLYELSVKNDANDANDANDKNDKENKKIKIDTTLFSAKVVSGIKMPNLPRGFKPLPEYDTDVESFDDEYVCSNKDISFSFENLTLLANVCSSI